MFEDSLQMKLKLAAANDAFEIPGGNIKGFKLDLMPYGYQCTLDFWVSNEDKEQDKLFQVFTTPNLLAVELELFAYNRPSKNKDETYILMGLVTDKTLLHELLAEEGSTENLEVLYRHYQIEFSDTANVLWRQHFPCDLMVDKSVKDLIEAHRGEMVPIQYDWDILDSVFPINTLSLGQKEHKASFYDFILWYVYSNNGVFSYNSLANKYTISKVKKDPEKPFEINRSDIHNYRIDFPESIRYHTNLLNVCAEKHRNQPAEQVQSIAGVYHDIPVRFPIVSDYDARLKLEKEKLIVREHEIYLTFNKVPHITYLPGRGVTLEGTTWSKNIYPNGKQYRIRSLSMDAKAIHQDVNTDHNEKYAGYRIDMSCVLELKEELWVPLPEFTKPLYPILVEGKVISEQGEETDKTYQFYTDSETSLDYYRIAIPLWVDQQVIAPYEPNFFAGHMYFPAFKHARVLVALDFHSAQIERFLDWGEGTRIPLDTQGNHVLFGKNDKSQTSAKYIYDNDKPKFDITRTSQNDIQFIKLEEGTMILETKEENND